MPSIVIRGAAIAGLLAFCTATVTAAPAVGTKPPRYIKDPLIGLRVATTAQLEPVPEALNALCKRVPEDTTTTAHLWIFASASVAGTSYYVFSGFSEVRKTPTDAPLYRSVERGGMYIVANGKCVSDPADEYFDAPTDEVPLPILNILARDLKTRLGHAFGGDEKLQAEIEAQRIDFGVLSPVLQNAFTPYFGSLIPRRSQVNRER
jgi:hypothetical protein